jgi:hypothetical protein
MSAPALPVSVPASTNAAASPVPTPPRWRSWLREPLLHFVALGGLVFGIDHLVVTRMDDPRTIVVGADVDREAIETFKAVRNRDPSSEELTALRKVWLENEVLYREGLALQVDRGDPAIRERVIFKALSVVDSRVKLPEIDDAGLRKWFEAHRDKYDEPPRLDFEDAALSGESSEATVKAFVAELTSGTPGDATAGLRVFKGRPQSTLVQSYGADVTKALAAATPGRWQAFKTKDGWRAMRLEAAAPPKPAVFESVRGVVLQDWKDETAAQQRSEAVHALAKKFKIVHQVPGGGGE